MDILSALWSFVGEASGLFTKSLIVFALLYIKQRFDSQDARTGELEDSHQSMIAGIKEVPSMNGAFTKVYDKSLSEARIKRDRLNNK